LISWLVEVHHLALFKPLPETLFLTVNLIDRFTELVVLKSISEYQLVGMTAMFIASKYEENLCSLAIADVMKITRYHFTR